MLKRLQSKRGSALIWAVCVMMVLVLISAGLLTVAMGYYNDTLDEVELKKAELLAQSGANYACEKISGNICDKNILGFDSVGAYKESETYSETINFSELDTANSNATLVFTITETSEKVKISETETRDRKVYILKAESTASCEGNSASCSAYFRSDEDDETWTFLGYAQS